MDQNQHTGVPGPAGRRLHIAHRRSPSEMTPMISESSKHSCILTKYTCLIRVTRHCENPNVHLANSYICSGTTGFATADRASSATAAADSCHTPAICKHGDDPTTAATTKCQLPNTTRAPDTSYHVRHVTPCYRLPVSTAASTATAWRSHECSNTAIITSP